MGTWIMRISLVVFFALVIYVLYTAKSLHTEPLAPSQNGQTFFNYEQGQLQLSYQIATAQPQTLASTWLQLPDKLIDLYQHIETKAQDQTGDVIASQVDLPFPQGWLDNINPIFPLLIKTYFDQNGQGYTDFYVNPQNLEWGESKKTASHLYFQGVHGRLQEILPTHQLEANLPELHIEQVDDFVLKLLEWQLQLEWHVDEKQVNLNLPFSQYTSRDFSLLLEALEVHYKASRPAARFMFTPAELSTHSKQIQLTENQNHHHLGGVGFGMVISQEEKSMSYHAALNLDKIHSPHLVALDLDNINIALALRFENVDIEALELMRQVLSDWQEQSLSTNVKTLWKMIDHQSKRLAKQGIGIEIEPLSIQTKHGDVQLQLAFKLDKSRPFSLENLTQFRKAIVADIDLTIHQNLLKHLLRLYQHQKADAGEDHNTIAAKPSPKAEKKLQQQIKKFLKQKLLSKKGEHYQLQATVQHGQLFINGREQPFPLFN